MNYAKNYNQKKLVDYVFWIILILFTNPGGILEFMGEDSNDGGIDVTDLLFLFLSLCFLLVLNKGILLKDRHFAKLLRYLFIFLLYYIIVFSFFLPQIKNNDEYSFFLTIIKIRHGIINILLVLYIYLFYLRSYRLFFKIFLYSSILVIFLFLISVVFGIEILPVVKMNRHYTETSRLFLVSYGLMPILIPMGVVVLIYNFKIASEKIIIFSSFLMFLVWLFALIRRNIFGTFLYFILASFLLNYMQHKSLIPLKKLMSVIVYAIIIVFTVQFTFPKYFEAGVKSVNETYHIIKYGRTVSGQKDARLGFGKKAIQDKIEQNFIVGTGYDDDWRRSEADGFEASDYPFLAAIAMAGLIGLLFFLPIYVVLIKSMIIDIKYLRKHKYDKKSFESFMLILFIVFFIYDLLKYMNWFLPLSLFTSGLQHWWYIFLAMYMASRNLFYKSEFQNKVKLTP